MTDLPNRIISVFLDKRSLALKDTEISQALKTNGVPCDTEDVRRYVQSLSPELFQLSLNRDGTSTVRVEPKIEICGPFLTTRCEAAAKTCDRLHICRHFDDCKTPNCHFPHDFARGNNRRVVTEHHCQHIDPVSLVRLLRLTKAPPSAGRSFNRGRGGRGRNQRTRGRGRGRGLANQFSSTLDLREEDPNRQVDVIFPSSDLAQQIDIEMIEMLLNLRGIKIERKLTENENEYFRRRTLQLKEINDVEELLSSPIINHEDVNIKFKRTNQLIDKTSFILKTAINNEQEKITEARLKLYIATLIGNNQSNKTTDLSSTSEQITLVQCNTEIEFDKLRHAYQSKKQLSGKDITLTQIYECDAVEIHYYDENKTIARDDVERILRHVWNDIFAFNFPTDHCVEVEFINFNAFRQWVSALEQIRNKFGISISPIIDSVDENNDTRSISSAQTTPSLMDTLSTASGGYDDKPHQTKIKLLPDWTMVAAHPKFKLEYKDYIRNEFGGEIDINDDEAIYRGNLPRNVRGSMNEVILGNKTKEFMEKFAYKTFHKLQQSQIDILRASSANVAFSCTLGNDYLVAATPSEMLKLKSKFFHKTNQPSGLNHANSIQNPRSNNHRGSFPAPPPLVKSESTEKPTPLLPNSPATSTSIYPITTPEQMRMFSLDTFEDRLRQYLEETFNVKTVFERSYGNEKSKEGTSRIMIKITGRMNDTESALNDLVNLFSSLRTKKFDDKTDGNWTKIEEATQVIQHHLKISNLICTCQQISSTNVHVYFFDITNPQFGIDEQTIEDLIKDKFSSATITFNPQSISSKFTTDWTGLEDTIRKRQDYKKDICLYKESNTIYLFGLPKLIKEFRQQFEQLKNKHVPQPYKITLSEKQLKYLAYVAKSDMQKLEKQYKSDGCDVSLTRLRQNCEFLAPLDMHTKIKDSLEALTQIQENTFEVNEPGFEVLVSNEPERLIALVKSKCYVEKNIDTCRVHVDVPTARVADLEDGVKPTASASATANTTSVSIGHSTVTILTGDLTAQPVDAIVACSTSEYLCKAIVTNAGPQVQAEYAALKSSGQFPGETSGGTLSCKKIFFLPWAPDSHDATVVKTSLSTFVSLAFQQAISEKYKSIAFPAVGCGKLGFDPTMIAKYMLHETRKQLIAHKTKMNISFVLLPDQQNVYNAFVQCLNEMQTINLSVSSKHPTKKTNDQSSIAYDRKTVKITLIGSNSNHLIKCKNDILELARSSSTKSHLANKHDMLDWSQNTINKFYEYCLKQRVIPTLDLSNVTLELVGPKDAVHEAEKYFYELTSETFKQARMHAVSRGIIWSVEVTPNSDNWEQYSFRLNGIIEDAFLKKSPYVDFTNDKQEKCRIVLSAMEEHHEEDIRRVRRKVVDSTLPDTWEPSDQNCKRVTLPTSSPEYKNVLAQFQTTMAGKYSQILKIERIQNERWYKQYAAHRDDYKRRYPKLDERLLFHGCAGTSANEIIQGCFNRSFAGVNGVLYGQGVYFHAQASYSHQYAHASGSGERTMFLARVLIGKTCKGGPSMKVVPAGYDTTTDGAHIFVVYHDAGAYADHLITYK